MSQIHPIASKFLSLGDFAVETTEDASPRVRAHVLECESLRVPKPPRSPPANKASAGRLPNAIRFPTAGTAREEFLGVLYAVSCHETMPNEDSGQTRVIVVSNRLPVALKRVGDTWRVEKGAGGLATAMLPILERTKGIWIGWSGDSSGLSDEKRKSILERWANRDRYYAVDLPAETVRGFYDGYSNKSIWPLFHHFPFIVKFNPDDWRAYVKANQIFCDAIVEHLRPGDAVWVHDYHLMLVPQMLREAMPQAKIGFFLHIPFPSSSVFRILPHREEMMRGLLGADYITFQTYSYLQHFRSSMLRILGVENQMDRVQVGGRTVRLEALPIGIAPNQFTDLLASDLTTRKRLEELKLSFADRKIIIGVDRLDYTKGIPERLRAFRRFLSQSPEWHGRVVLIQVAVPSRERVSQYKELRKEVDELVGQINGQWSTPEWTPVIYLRRGIPRSELTALYAAADAALITPLRDGLNLVAKEYTACKSEGNGVLILSEFAGAAAEMGEALLINPYDEERTAEAIGRALTMPEEERRDRMLALYRRVIQNTVFVWGDRFIQNLEDSVSHRAERLSHEPEPLPKADVRDAFSSANRRLLLLDYDGTLQPYAKRPQDAAPGDDLKQLLAELARTLRTEVAVVSGRSRDDLEAWFGSVPNLWLAAEHGAVVRSPHTTNWEHRHSSDSREWKPHVYPVLDHFVKRTPGSFIEEKEFSLVWHYRMSDPIFGDWLANELVANLQQMLADTHVIAVKGQKTVEVKVIWANKGEVIDTIKKATVEPDFLLALGDDVTDEDLFARLPETAWSIHVGRRSSRARFRLDGPEEVRELLREFIGAKAETATAI